MCELMRRRERRASDMTRLHTPPIYRSMYTARLRRSMPLAIGVRLGPYEIPSRNLAKAAWGKCGRRATVASIARSP